MTAPARHLALVAPSFRGGGAERVLVELARSFAERGHDVDLVVARAVGPLAEDVSRDVRVVDLEAPRVARALPGLARYLRRERPDAVLSTLAYLNVVAIAARRVTGVRSRLVVREANTLAMTGAHGKNRRDRLLPRIVGPAYRCADAVIAPSAGVADDLVTTCGVPRGRIRVIPSPSVPHDVDQRIEGPIDHRWFRDDGVPVVLAMGRLVPQKDFGTLIDAFARLRSRRNARLAILGEGRLRGALEQRVHDAGLDADVWMPGFVANPFPYLARAAVFVLSSAWEGMPNVLVQAMAAGTTVVATDCPNGPRDVLDGGRLGALVPVGDAAAMAQAIETALRSPMAPDVLRDAVGSYRANTVADAYLGILLGVDGA